MGEVHGNVRTEVAQRLAELRALGDESRLKLHLASMDARDTWRALEARIEAAERWTREATPSATDALTDFAKDVQTFLGCL